jgi:methyl-accepting chemotaxis protein
MTAMNRLRNVSLKWKLTAALVVLGLLPMAAVIYLADANAREEHLDRSGRLLELRAASTIDTIDRNFFERYGDAQAFAFNPMAQGKPEEVTAAANYYTTTYGLYDLIIVADADGKVIAANTVTADGKPLDTSGLIGRSVKTEEWFQACRNGLVPAGESYAQDVSEDKWVAEVYRTRGLAVNFSAPIRDKSGKIVRVWSNRASWARTVEHIMKEVRESSQGMETQLVSKSGVLVDDYDPKAVLSFNLREAGLKAAELAGEGKTGYVVEEHKRRKVEQINGYSASRGFLNYKGFGWGALVRQDTADVMAATVATRTKLLTLAGISAAVLLVAALWLGVTITRPIRKMMVALGEVANGDLTQHAEAKGRDEIGQMADAFNATVTGIRTALQQEKVDWGAIGKQREQNADYGGQIAAVNKAQAVIEFNLDGTIRTANDNFLATLGYALPEIQGRHHSMFVDPTTAAGHEYREFWARLNRGEYVVGEFLRHSKGGKEVWILASYNPIFDPNGKPYKVVKYATDITAAKNLERQVKEGAERQEAAAAELRRKVDAILGSVSALAAGDFTRAVPDLGGDAVGRMAAELNRAIASVQATLAGVRAVSDQLADASGQMSAAGEEIAAGAQEQASGLEETASTLEEITATVRQNADSAQQARQLASGSREVAEKGGQVVGAAVEAMAAIDQSSKRIADIIGTIDEIAFQTNLLALNAAVEAARAGEQGRGFAVVAAEVRNLAQRSATAAKEIKALIQDSVRKVEAGTDLVNRSGATLHEIVTSVKRVTDIVTEIAAASREQTTGIEQVNKAVAQMDAVTQRNASQTEEMSATAAALTGQAAQLRDLVGQFRLGPDAAPPPPPKRAKPKGVGKPRPRFEMPRAAANGDGHADELDAIGEPARGETDGFKEL